MPKSPRRAAGVRRRSASRVSPIEIGAVAGLAAAAPLQAALLAAIERRLPVVIDASAVTSLSAACVQVLVSGARALAEAAVPFTVRQPSDAFVDAFSDLGLFAQLMEWPVEAVGPAE